MHTTPYSYFGIHFNTWCPLGCKHCFTNSSSRASKQTANLDLAESLGRCVVRRNPNTRMVVTGGEPFVFRKQLLELLRRAHLLGVETSLHTNGFWGGRDWAEDALRAMIPYGLTRVNLSTDDYHEKQLPLSKVKKAAQTILDLGLNLRIPVTYGPKSKLRPNTVLKAIGLSEHERLEVFPVSLSRSGGAETLSNEEFYQTDQAGSCSKLVNPVLFANGELSPCSGSAFSSIFRPGCWTEQLAQPKSEKEIESLLADWEREPLLHAILCSGPRAVHQKLLERRGLAPLEPLERAGSCECESCNQLFSDKHLREPLANLRQHRRNLWAVPI